MDANLTHTTDVCSCGAPPSEWEMLADTVAKGRSRLAVGLGVIAAMFGALILFSVIAAMVSGDVDSGKPVALGFFFGGGAIYFSYKIFTTKPARSQVLKCRSCGTTIKRIQPGE